MGSRLTTTSPVSITDLGAALGTAHDGMDARKPGKIQGLLGFAGTDLKRAAHHLDVGQERRPLAVGPAASRQGRALRILRRGRRSRSRQRHANRYVSCGHVVPRRGYHL